MKRNDFIAMMVAFIAGLFSIGLIACGALGGGHTHNYGTTWQIDETNHWHECSVADCPEKEKDKAPHADTDNDGKCDVCEVDLQLRFSEIKDSDTDVVIGYTVAAIKSKSAQSVDIPSDYNDKPVTSIGRYAFEGCTGLKSVTIPDSVTSIGLSAFEGCTSLKSVYINDVAKWCNIEFVGVHSNPISYAHDLYLNGELVTELTIPDSVTSIGKYSFMGCTGLTSIVIPESITSIGWSAFHGCTGLKSVAIPDSVTSIGDTAFYGCTSLTGVYINDVAKWCNIEFEGSHSNPISYAHNLYLNGKLVTELTIPDSVTSIGNYAFSGCTGLTSITIPDSVTTINEWVFSGCTSLTSMAIGNSVTTIGRDAFYGCTGLKSVAIPDSVTSIGDTAFSGCTGLTSIAIPDSVTTINEWVFSGCTSLMSMAIGNSVTSIGRDAFSGCMCLTSVTIPDSVTSIGWSVFEGCTGLTNIKFKGTKAQWNEISKGGDWNYNTGNYTVHCIDGDIAKK